MTTSNQRVFPLLELEVESLVNDAGEPFITVRAKGTMRGEPMLLVGQIDTQTSRLQGMTFIEAAEAADTDAALFGFTVETADDGATREDILNRAAAFVSALRDYRRQRPTVEALIDPTELEELPEIEVGGLIRVAGSHPRYYRAPDHPSPIGWTRDDKDSEWVPTDQNGRPLEAVTDPDPTEIPFVLTPPGDNQ